MKILLAMALLGSTANAQITFKADNGSRTKISNVTIVGEGDDLTITPKGITTKFSVVYNIASFRFTPEHSLVITMSNGKVATISKPDEVDAWWDMVCKAFKCHSPKPWEAAE